MAAVTSRSIVSFTAIVPSRSSASTRGFTCDSRVKAANAVAFGDPADTFHQCCRPEIGLVVAGGRPDPVERSRHDLLQACRDLGLSPEVLLKTLDPLEVRHHH